MTVPRHEKAPQTTEVEVQETQAQDQEEKNAPTRMDVDSAYLSLTLVEDAAGSEAGEEEPQPGWLRPRTNVSLPGSWLRCCRFHCCPG